MSLEARNDEFSSKIVYAAVVTRGEHVACARLRPRGALKLRRCLIRYPERPLEPSDHKRPCLPIAPILLQHSASFAQHLCSARTCPRLQASCWIVSRGLRCLILLPRDGLQAIGTRRRAPPSNPYYYSTVHSLLANCLVIFLQMPPKGKPRFSSVKRKTGENPHVVLGDSYQARLAAHHVQAANTLGQDVLRMCYAMVRRGGRDGSVDCSSGHGTVHPCD